MHTFRSLLGLGLILCFLSFLGCEKKPVPITGLPLSEAHKKFVELCRNDYGMNPVLKALNNTLWIYLPLDGGFLTFKATEDKPLMSKNSKTAPTIKFLDGRFEDNIFHLEYDIEAIKTYEKVLGYTSSYSEEFQTKQRELLTAIIRAYSYVERGKSTSAPDDKVPDFFVIVLADIENGLESTIYLYYDDLKRASTDVSFGEEYVRRIINDQPTGHVSIKGDKEGVHLDYHDITLPEFLTKQMLYRIRFKYERSAFPASENTRDEVLSQVAETLSAYSFTDYDAVALHDLGGDRHETINKPAMQDEIRNIKPGQYYTIEFDLLNQPKK